MPHAACRMSSAASCIVLRTSLPPAIYHFRYFVGRVAKEVWVVDKGTVTKAESFDKYRAVQLAKLK